MRNALSPPDGTALRRLRLERGLTQQQFGDLIGLSKTNVSRYEKGQRGMQVGRAMEIAAALGVSPAVFFGMDDKEYAAPPPMAPESHWGRRADKLAKALGDCPESTWNEILRLAKAYASLNRKGQCRALSRMDELAQIPRYKKEGDTHGAAE